MRMVMDDGYASPAGLFRVRFWSFGMWQVGNTAQSLKETSFGFSLICGATTHAANVHGAGPDTLLGWAG